MGCSMLTRMLLCMRRLRFAHGVAAFAGFLVGVATAVGAERSDAQITAVMHIGSLPVCDLDHRKTNPGEATAVFGDAKLSGFRSIRRIVLACFGPSETSASWRERIAGRSTRQVVSTKICRPPWSRNAACSRMEVRPNSLNLRISERPVTDIAPVRAAK
jgi:hypothetical protein